MHGIYDFNHIDPSLKKEKVETLKVLYAYYHKKHFGYEKLYHSYRRKNFVCNLSAGKLIITATVAGGITLNSAVIATLTGVGLILKAAASLKKYEKKQQQIKLISLESNTKESLTRYATTSEANLSTKKPSLTD